jgi:hypothetical protein
MRKCPKCRKMNYDIIEVWEGKTITWGPDMSSLDEGVKEMGDPYCVFGSCHECGHEWRFRGVSQVNEEMLQSLLETKSHSLTNDTK